MAKTTKNEPRSHHAIAMCGRKHTGKSTELNKYAEAYSKKKVIIINPNGSPAYSKHPIVTYEQLKRFKSGIVQFYDPDKNRMWDFFLDLWDIQAGKPRFDGLLIIEEATKLIPKQPTDRMMSFLVDHRMWGADLYFTFHSLEKVPPYFWDLISILTIKKTQDLVDEESGFYKKRIPNFAAWYPKWKEVKESKDPFISKSVATLI